MFFHTTGNLMIQHHNKFSNVNTIVFPFIERTMECVCNGISVITLPFYVLKRWKAQEVRTPNNL